MNLLILNLVFALLLPLILYFNLFSLTIDTTTHSNHDQNVYDCVKLSSILLKYTTFKVKQKLESLLRSIESIQHDDIAMLDNRLDRMTAVVSQVYQSYDGKITSFDFYFKDLLFHAALMNTACKRVSDMWTNLHEMKLHVKHNFINSLQTIKQRPLDTLSDLNTSIEQVEALLDSAKKYFAPLLALSKKNPRSRTGNGAVADKIIQGLVKAFYGNTKRVLSDTSEYLDHLTYIQDKLKMQEHINDAAQWLTTYNTTLCNFILKECLYSFETFDDPVALKKNFDQLEDDLVQFLVVTADISLRFEDSLCGAMCQEIGDVELYMTYSSLCRRAEKLLAFGRDVFSQREDITSFVQKHKFLKDALYSCKETSLLDHFYQDLMARFSWITFPQLEIIGLDKIVYDYQQALYLELSSMKLDFIQYLSK